MMAQFKSLLLIPVLVLGLNSSLFAMINKDLVDGPAVIIAVKPNGIVVAKDAKDHQFSFQVKDPAMLRSLQAGQTVLVNQRAGRVSVRGADSCCEIVK